MIQDEGKAYQTWLQDLSAKARSTQQVYLAAFEAFLERWDLNPDKMYEMRMADLESGDPRDKQNVERMVKVYMNELLEEGKAPSTVRQVSKAVGSFMESQNLELKLKAKDKPRVVSNGQSLALASHIRTMYDQVSPEMRERNRAIIMVLKDSGLRVSDISLINMEDWEKARTLKTEVGEFKVFEAKATKKTGDLAYIHLGPESVNAVREYLKVRPEWTPRPKEKDEKESLFLDRPGTRMSNAAMSTLMKNLGLKTGSGKVSAHSFRKFHRTKLEGAGMPEAWVKKLQGKTADVYSKPEETGQLTHDPKDKKGYIDCYHALRIFGTEATTKQVEEQASEIEKLKAENEELRKRVDALSKADARQDEHDAILVELLKRIERLEKGRETGEQPAA